MTKVVIPYEKEYVLEYYMRPGLWMTPEERSRTLAILKEVNEKSGKNFTYGIFDKHVNVEEFLSKIFLCLITKHDEVHGFFFSYLACEETPLVHQGLALIYKNDGVDIFVTPYQIKSLLIHKYFKKDYYITNICANSKGIGLVWDCFSNVWPSPQANLSRPPPRYKEMLVKLEQNYVKKYFPNPENSFINLNRFVLKSEVRHMGFDTNFHDLARDHRFDVLMFCFMWIKHQDEEDLVQVGMFTQDTKSRSIESVRKWMEKAIIID